MIVRTSDTRRIFFTSVFNALLIVVFGSCQQQDNSNKNTHRSLPVISISNHSQLFLDDHLIAKMSNLKRELQRPEKHPANPVIVQDAPWEQRYMQMYGTVLYDEETNHFRAWYMASESQELKPETYICYAESLDGIHWIKPPVGSIALPGHTRHNAVLAGAHGLCVMKDTRESDPAKRYKGLGGEVLAFSPDGIHWTTETFQSAEQNDTSSSAVWWRGDYLAYIRNQEPWKQSLDEFVRRFSIDQSISKRTIREVAFTASPNFLHWTPKETIFAADSKDGHPWTQPYGMAVTPYGDQLIALVWFIHLDRIKGNTKIGDQDVQLAVSRDGRRWKRVADRAVFLESTANTWDRERVYPSTTMIVKDDRIYIYYSGSGARHGEGWGNMGIGLATLPVDRFLALRPEKTGVEGVLETRPLYFSGDDLLVNAEAPEGGLQVELLNSNGTVIPGFDRRRSHLEKHGLVRYCVTWGNGENVKSLKTIGGEKPIAIRFFIKSGAFYAFQIQSATPQIENSIPAALSQEERTEYERENRRLSEAIEQESANASLYFKRAELHYKKGNEKLALADYTKAIELEPNRSEFYHHRGVVNFFLTEYPLALDDFDKAVELNPKNFPALKDLTWTNLVVNNLEKAAELFGKILEITPDDPIAYCYRGFSYQLKEQPERALVDFNKAIQLDETCHDAYYGRSNIYFEQKKYKQAIADLTKAISLKPSETHPVKSRAMIYFLTNQYELALKDLSKVIAFDANNPMLYKTRAFSYLRLNDFPRAIADINRSIELDPDDLDNYKSRGVIHASAGNYDSAIEDYKRVIPSEPSWAYYEIAKVYSHRASKQTESQKKKQDVLLALDCLEKAVQSGFNDWNRLKKEPQFTTLRQESRFQQLIENR